MLVIRFMRTGKKGERKFRLVVMERRSRRDGKSIDSLGWYEKRETGENKNIDMDKYKEWIAKGAQPSKSVLELIEK